MDGFREGYEYFSRSAGSAQAAFAGEAYVDGIIQEINNLSENINKFNGSHTASKQLKGDIAEFWHSGTFNIDAAVKGSNSRSEVLRSHGLGSIDIKVNDTDAYGSKYDATAAETLRQQAKTFYERYKEYASTCERSGRTAPTFEEYIAKNADTLRENGIDPEKILAHDPLYGQQYRLVPSDQIEALREAMKENDAKYSLIITHVPLGSKGLDQSLFEFTIADINERNAILKVIDENGSALTLSGHHHKGGVLNSWSGSHKEYIFSAFHKRDLMGLESPGLYYLVSLDQDSGMVTVKGFLIDNINPDIANPDLRLSFFIK